MRISDWSSDVCSSDLSANRLPGPDGCTTVPSGRVTGRAEISGGAPSGPPQPATIAAIAHTARYCRMSHPCLPVVQSVARDNATAYLEHKGYFICSKDVHTPDRKSTRLNSSH